MLEPQEFFSIITILFNPFILEMRKPSPETQPDILGTLVAEKGREPKFPDSQNLLHQANCSPSSLLLGIHSKASPVDCILFSTIESCVLRNAGIQYRQEEKGGKAGRQKTSSPRPSSLWEDPTLYQVSVGECPDSFSTPPTHLQLKPFAFLQTFHPVLNPPRV